VRGQCQLLDKNHQYFQLFHCQQTQSLLITLYFVCFNKTKNEIQGDQEGLFEFVQLALKKNGNEI
jgi:hypothetical protein